MRASEAKASADEKEDPVEDKAPVIIMDGSHGSIITASPNTNNIDSQGLDAEAVSSSHLPLLGALTRCLVHAMQQISRHRSMGNIFCMQ